MGPISFGALAARLGTWLSRRCRQPLRGPLSRNDVVRLGFLNSLCLRAQVAQYGLMEEYALSYAGIPDRRRTP